jgi:hypothetical protein
MRQTSLGETTFRDGHFRSYAAIEAIETFAFVLKILVVKSRRGKDVALTLGDKRILNITHTNHYERKSGRLGKHLGFDICDLAIEKNKFSDQTSLYLRFDWIAHYLKITQKNNLSPTVWYL